MKHTIICLTGAVLFAASAFATSPNVKPALTGGVGESSQQAIEEIQKDYNTKLVFTGHGGFYLANVDVSIRDKNGVEVTKGKTDGPFLLTNLEKGKYTVEAIADGINKKQSIVVGNTLKTYQFQFPIKDEPVYNQSNDAQAQDNVEDKGYSIFNSSNKSL